MFSWTDFVHPSTVHFYPIAWEDHRFLIDGLKPILIIQNALELHKTGIR